MLRVLVAFFHPYLHQKNYAANWLAEDEVVMRRLNLITFVGVVGCLALAGPASANLVVLDSASQINTTPYGFDNLAPGFVDGSVNAITSQAGFTFPDIGSSGEFIAMNSDGGHVLDVLGSRLGFDGLVRLRFNDLVSAAGIEYDTSTPLFFLAYDDNGNLINNFDIIADANTSGFFGLQSTDVGIREILIHDSAGSFELDNLRFQTAIAPLPGALTLAAIGLGCIGWLRRRA